MNEDIYEYSLLYDEPTEIYTYIWWDIGKRKGGVNR